MRKFLFGLLVAAFICLSGTALAFDKEMGKLEFPESGYSQEIAQSHISIYTIGTGYGLIPVWNEKRQDTDYEWGLGTFSMSGSGFVVRGNYVITAAHVVDPRIVLVQTGLSAFYQVRMYQQRTRQIYAATRDEPGPELEVLYSNVEQDIAVLKFVHPRIPFKESPIEVVQTLTAIPMGFFGFLTVDLINPDDAICTIVHQRNESDEKTWLFEVRKGKVRENGVKLPENFEPFTPWFSLYDFTMDLDIRPGDSGSPIIAFRNGVPVIIGVARAGIWEAEGMWTYAVRVDSIFPLLWAVK